MTVKKPFSFNNSFHHSFSSIINHTSYVKTNSTPASNKVNSYPDTRTSLLNKVGNRVLKAANNSAGTSVNKTTSIRAAPNVVNVLFKQITTTQKTTTINKKK